MNAKTLVITVVTGALSIFVGQMLYAKYLASQTK